jgi:hypothetical protein
MVAKPISAIIPIIIGVVFISLILIVMLIALFSFLGQPKCPNTYIASNQKTLRIRTDGYYTVGEEICHDYSACNNPLAPCVYSTITGSSCPGMQDYTGSRLTNNDVCINTNICPSWSGVGFIEQGFSLQQSTDPLYITNCGITEDNLTRVWPSNCIRGVFGFNEADELWYCMEQVLDCPAGQTLVRGLDGIFRCSPTYY